MNEELLLQAGKIASQVREETREKIVLDADFISIVEYAEQRIVDLGGQIAWVQINDTTTAAHFSPTPKNNPVCKKGDLIKVDIGVHIDGFIADTAFSVAIPTSDAQIQKRNDILIQTSKDALHSALAIAKTGTELRDLGIAQMSAAQKQNCTTITNLGGHSIGRYQVHSGMTIPTYDNHDSFTLQNEMTIAIEPFITMGDERIKESGQATIFMQIADKSVRSLSARKLLVFIKKRQGLPFHTKDLLKEFGEATTTLGLRDLLQHQVIRGYPPLVSVSGDAIAQTEHSVIVKNESIVYTK